MKPNFRQIFLALSLSSSLAAADTITMKNGNTMDGIILKETPTEVTLSLGVGSVTIRRSQIAAIRKTGEQSESSIKDGWQQQYFAHEKYVPKGLEDLAAAYRAVESQRNAALENLARLRSPAAGRKPLLDELQRLQQESVDCMRKLPPTVPPADSEHAADIASYNALIARHNAIKARMAIVNDELAKKLAADDVCRRQISSYLQSLAGFRVRFDSRFDQYRKTEGTRQEDIFFAEMAKRINAYSNDIRETDVPFDEEGPHAVVIARINDQVDARLLLDTGASTVQISEALARRLNLQLPEETQVKVRLADGSDIDAKAVILDSVQVADARAERVAGVVTAAEVSPGIDGLLGMSFLQGFDVRLDGASRKLILNRFDPKP